MVEEKLDSFKTRKTMVVGGRRFAIRSLPALEKAGFSDVARLPASLRVLLENLLRSEDGNKVTRDDIEAVARWDPTATPAQEIAFTPARVLLQDFTGVPAVVDLAAMRDAMARMGGDPSTINPLQLAENLSVHLVKNRIEILLQPEQALICCECF